MDGGNGQLGDLGAQSRTPIAVPPVVASGPYTQLAGGTQLQPGNTYLVSAPSMPGVTLARVAAQLQAKATVNQMWDVGQVPANWPPSDSDPSRWRLSIVPGQPLGVEGGVAAFSTGVAQQNPSTPICPSGQVWNGTQCVPAPPSPTPACPSGQMWNGTQCVPVTMPTQYPSNVVSAAQAAFAAIQADTNYCSDVSINGSAVNAAVHAFKVAWNAWAAPSGGQLAYNGQYDTATASALSQVLNNVAMFSPCAPPPPPSGPTVPTTRPSGPMSTQVKCPDGSVHPVGYVCPPPHAHVPIPVARHAGTAVSGVGGVGQLPDTAQAALKALQSCSGQWQYTTSPENAQVSLGNGIVPASSLPSGLRDALQCASLAGGVPPAIPDVFQLPLLIWQGPSSTMYVLISYGQWSGTFACVATQAAPVSKQTGDLGARLPGAHGTRAVPRRETGFQPGPLTPLPNQSTMAQPGTLQSVWQPIDAAQVPASVLQLIQGGTTPGWGNIGWASGSAPMTTGNQTLYGPYYTGSNAYAIVSTPQQNQWGGYYSSDQWYVLAGTMRSMMSGAPTGVGQAPSCAQFGLSQAACDAAYAYGQAYQQSGGTMPDPTSVLTTFKQWYTAATGQAPTPTLDVTQPPASTILSSAFSYWTQFANLNPTAAAQITAWNFPWQYVPPQGSAIDPQTAVLSAILSMLQSPAVAQVLNQGQLPAFDPTQVSNWAAAFQDPATFATLASGVAAMIPAVEAFVQQGSQCALFSQSPAIVQQAFTNYMTYGGNPQDPRGVPCNAVTGPTGGPPIPPPPTPAGPTGATGGPPPVVIQGQVPSPTPAWVPYAVAAGGALVVGTLIYAFTRPSAHHGGAAENPLSYAGWRAAVANQLVNRYDVPYQHVNQILDMPGPNGSPMAYELFTLNVTPSLAAQRIAMTYHQRVPALHGERTSS